MIKLQKMCDKTCQQMKGLQWCEKVVLKFDKSFFLQTNLTFHFLKVHYHHGAVAWERGGAAGLPPLPIGKPVFFFN